MKIFIIGLDKTGTKSVDAFFKYNGFRTIRWARGSLSKEIVKNKASGNKILKRFESFDVYSDSDELVQNYKTLDEQYPNSKFILTTRNINNWIVSKLNNPSGRDNLNEHSLNDIIDYWTDEWNDHHDDVIEYFKERPEDLLVYDTEKDDFFKIKEFFNNYFDLRLIEFRVNEPETNEKKWIYNGGEYIYV